MRIYWLLYFFLLSTQIFTGQERYTLSGKVTETESNETIIGVNILFPTLKTGTNTNEYGFYSITLPAGTYEVQVTGIGYQLISERIELNRDLKKDFFLSEKVEELTEVLIEKNLERVNIQKPEMSVNRLRVETVKNIPVVLGEADIIKSILLLPGVTSAGENASGFNVRGGAVDQNLILLDEATIFNSSHLFGLFSVFNPDAIKDLKLYKGAIPARYGGRVSSVLEIFQKEGNSKEFHANGGIGAVSSRLLLEGPIEKDRSAFLVGGRASYAHLFLPLFDINNSAYFYDLNTKLNYRLDENNDVFLSGYFGRDVFKLSDNFVNTYGNSVLNFRWNHLFSDKLFSNLSLIYSDYYYGLELGFAGFKWNSGILNFNAKYDLKHYLNDRLQINYGIHNTYYVFNPGKIKPNSEESGITESQLTKKYANETAVYIGVEQEISDKFRINYGLRLSHFIRFGQDELYVYENDRPVIFDPFQLIYKSATASDTIHPARSEQLSNFTNLEPRVAISYSPNENNSFKASFIRMSQYLHLLSNTSSPTPLDVWTPSGPYIKPQLLNQYALGYFHDFSQKIYGVETEVFYKEGDNRIDYIDGAELIANNAIEQVILNGETRAYGLELLFRKYEGKLQGWIAYTLSKSEQRTPGRTVENTARTPKELGINRGKWYNTAYDKRHDVAVFASFELNKKWSFSGNFIYQTGQPTNYPIGQFEFQGLTIPYYGFRNEQRLPDYHRLDLSAKLIPEKNESRNWKSEWIFSIYNVYNRMNAASINFRRNMDTGQNEAVRTSIFGIVPSVTYNFKF